ncbi:RNA polymerase sigma factor [Streptomyces sp. NPDC059262]|uniref:RNA polymerase sigma factor n=1 Tax=Streptomyces sp. NPDC059262 TaxID=3346797 RepID=UPI00368AFC70
MDPDRVADEELLARAATEPAAFEPLVARHSVALHGYLALRTPAAADDLLSEVWLQAFAHRHTFDAARRAARAWLFGVARNVLARHWQRIARDSGPPLTEEQATSDPWQAVDQRLDTVAAGPLIHRKLTELRAIERAALLQPGSGRTARRPLPGDGSHPRRRHPYRGQRCEGAQGRGGELEVRRRRRPGHRQRSSRDHRPGNGRNP